MPRNPTNRVTPDKREIAERLYHTWQRKKRELGITQSSVAERLGISQSALSQYLHGVVATNTDIVIKLANVMGVDPKEIDPKILVTSAPRISLAPRKLLYRGGLMGDLAASGETIAVVLDGSIPDQNLSVVVMDTDHFSPRYFEGEHLILQHIYPSDISLGDELLIQWPEDNNELFRAGNRVADQHELMDLLEPKRHMALVPVHWFEGNVFKVVGRT